MHKQNLSTLLLATFVALFLIACGGGGSSSGGGGTSNTGGNSGNDSTTSQSFSPANNSDDTNAGGDDDTTPAPTTSNVVGPNLNGNWSGYLSSDITGYENLTAVITHVGNQVTIQTSIASGPARELKGTIKSKGGMSMLDSVTGQTWTTHYIPATGNSIELVDFVFEFGEKVDEHILKLRR